MTSVFNLLSHLIGVEFILRLYLGKGFCEKNFRARYMKIGKGGGYCSSENSEMQLISFVVTDPEYWILSKQDVTTLNLLNSGAKTRTTYLIKPNLPHIIFVG